MEKRTNKINLSIHNFSPLVNGKKLYKGLNFDLKDGEIIAVMGMSGIGKTLLLESISNHWPHSGTKKIYQSMFKVFQHSWQLFPWMSIGKNLELACGKKQVADILSLWNIIDHKNKLPHQLSVGQRQRVTMARALYRDEKILFCDEPLSGVDSITRLQISRDLKKKFKLVKKSILWITHDVLEAKEIADRILIITKKNNIQIDPIKGVDEIIKQIK
jgi:ABC-type nitrate/sulfonate/bicarbonate transport system ATPase subunit